MEKLLEEILGQLKTQTLLLERIAKISDAREFHTGEAKDALKKAAEAFKGTPFEKIIGAAVRGGNLDGK